MWYTLDCLAAARTGFIHADHLGSTSLTTDITGTVVAETRYLPYGEERWTSGGAVSDYTFTGQRAERGFGLMDYNARYYDPGLGRFVSADTVVPQAGNPQALNRYAYVLNNPLRHTDPSGNWVCEDVDCESPRDPANNEAADTVQAVSMLGAWPTAIASAQTVERMSNKVKWGLYQERSWHMPVLRPQREGLIRVPSSLARFATATTYGLPIVSGGINYFDINSRRASGELTESQATAENAVNTSSTIGNLTIAHGLNVVGSKAATAVAAAAASGSTPTLASAVLGSPVFLGTAAAGVAVVTSWEYQTANNLIEGMPPEQAWKSARDTTFEPVLNLFSLNRETHPQWYWYP
jgi:RHS repeat-associated protein